MDERRIAVFRSRLRPGVDDDQTEQLARLAKITSRGGVEVKQFTAVDGERLSLFEWNSPE